MNLNRCTTFCMLGFLLSLLCFQMPSSVLGASLNENSNHRMLDNDRNNHYVRTREETIGNSLHYFAEHKDAADSYGSSKIIKKIEVIVSFHDKNTFRVKIIDEADKNRWQIPETVPYPHFASENTISKEDSCCTVDVAETEKPFRITIKRKDTSEVLFDTTDKNFLFSDLYIELSTALPSDIVYGFGERNYKFKRTPGTYTIWGRDDAKILENGQGGGNTYSQHPVGLFKGKDKNFYLTLMRNSNAMDIEIDDKPSLTYRMVGGVIDLVFFVGDQSPETVLKSYHNYLGNFTMMPFWSMGFHQSKWGYSKHSIMNDVVQKYTENGLPLDVIWSDIDYMIDKEIFTVDTYNFPLAQMRELQTKHKKKWVPIIDPGVRRNNPRGPGLNEGLKRDVFLKNHKGNNLEGYVWPGSVYFPDVFHANTEKWWGDMLEVLYQMIPFDGIWLDMNEVANFVEGEEHRYDKNRYDNLPYTPGKFALNHKTISLDAKHANGVEEYNLHGLFSLLECQMTHKFLQTKSKLPFILTRSTSAGVGKFSAHWTGDNEASWDFLKYSIAGNFDFQIFGIPFVGADICGFMEHTNEELCARWTQLGALYPFARNHHEEKTRNQEPWTFDQPNRGVSVLDTTRIALKTRYSLLKWYYSLFIETGGAGSVFRPLMFEFPDDQELQGDGFTDWEFLLGKGVLCTPKVEQGEPFVTAHFPKATWYNLFNGSRVIEEETSSSTRSLRVETPFDAPVPMFLRAGHMVHRQKVDKVLSTADLNNEFELVVALANTAKDLFTAEGFMMGISEFSDNSVHDRCIGDNCLYNVNVTFNESREECDISFKSRKEGVKLDSFGLFELKLYGLPYSFMFEDESKEGYAYVSILRQGETEYIDVEVMRVVSIENNAFSLVFEETLTIGEGDVLNLQFFM